MGENKAGEGGAGLLRVVGPRAGRERQTEPERQRDRETGREQDFCGSWCAEFLIAMVVILDISIGISDFASV